MSEKGIDLSEDRRALLEPAHPGHVRAVVDQLFQTELPEMRERLTACWSAKDETTRELVDIWDRLHEEDTSLAAIAALYANGIAGSELDQPALSSLKLYELLLRHVAADWTQALGEDWDATSDSPAVHAFAQLDVLHKRVGALIEARAGQPVSDDESAKNQLAGLAALVSWARKPAISDPTNRPEWRELSVRLEVGSPLGDLVAGVSRLSHPLWSAAQELREEVAIEAQGAYIAKVEEWNSRVQFLLTRSESLKLRAIHLAKECATDIQSQLASIHSTRSHQRSNHRVPMLLVRVLTQIRDLVAWIERAKHRRERTQSSELSALLPALRSGVARLEALVPVNAGADGIAAADSSRRAQPTGLEPVGTSTRMQHPARLHLLTQEFERTWAELACFLDVTATGDLMQQSRESASSLLVDLTQLCDDEGKHRSAMRDLVLVDLDLFWTNLLTTCEAMRIYSSAAARLGAVLCTVTRRLVESIYREAIRDGQAIGRPKPNIRSLNLADKCDALFKWLEEDPIKSLPPRLEFGTANVKAKYVKFRDPVAATAGALQDCIQDALMASPGHHQVDEKPTIRTAADILRKLVEQLGTVEPLFESALKAAGAPAPPGEDQPTKMERGRVHRTPATVANSLQCVTNVLQALTATIDWARSNPLGVDFSDDVPPVAAWRDNCSAVAAPWEAIARAEEAVEKEKKKAARRSFRRRNMRSNSLKGYPSG